MNSLSDLEWVASGSTDNEPYEASTHHKLSAETVSAENLTLDSSMSDSIKEQQVLFALTIKTLIVVKCNFVTVRITTWEHHLACMT